MSTVTLSRLAALLAAAAVILGALGAHGPVHQALIARDTLSYWEKAVFYHLIHAVVLWTLAGWTERAPGAAWAFLVGIAGFSGSLYILALNKIGWIGPVTPLGGLALIIGWVWLAAIPNRRAAK